MKNQDKATANYVKWFTKKKSKFSFAQIEDSEDLTPGPPSKCKFCEKEYRPNECWHL